MELKKYEDAPAEIKARLARTTHNQGDKMGVLSNRINNALSMARKHKKETTKYNDFIYILEPKKQKGKIKIFFDEVGYNEREAKNERLNAKIQIAYLEFLDETKSINKLPRLLYNAGLFGSYGGAWQAVNCGRFQRAEVRDFVLNWLKEQGKEIKL